MRKIQLKENSVSIPKEDRKEFAPDKKLKAENIGRCLIFATEMAYGDGFHKSQSFGGTNHDRTPEEIFINTFQGKLAELAVSNQLFNLGIKPDSRPEFDTWGKGKWEDCDFTLKKGRIRCSVKSTKHFGNLLLLEKNKYNTKGEFLETVDTVPFYYDFTFLVRIAGIKSPKPDYYTNFGGIDLEVTGFMTYKKFQEIIAQKQIIKKGTLLGIPLIVDNYYILAKDLTEMKDFKI